MWGVVETARLAGFERQRAIVGVFVATGYDQSVIDWMFRSWEQFNIDFGRDWHLFMPTTKEINGKVKNVTAESFNLELSLKFQSLYGLSRDDLPAIVFDNFNDEERQVVISLKRKDENDLRAMLETCQEVIQSRKDAKEKSLYEYRSQVAGDILNKSQTHAVGRLLVKLAPIAGSVARLFH